MVSGCWPISGQEQRPFVRSDTTIAAAVNGNCSQFTEPGPCIAHGCHWNGFICENAEKSGAELFDINAYIERVKTSMDELKTTMQKEAVGKAADKLKLDKH